MPLKKYSFILKLNCICCQNLNLELLPSVTVFVLGHVPQYDDDVGLALIRIFGRMAALVSDRLNQVPEKHFLTFLDLIGTQLQPPQPAKVPLTFSLAEGRPDDLEAFVPLGTQVAAPSAEGQEEVVFETEHTSLLDLSKDFYPFGEQPRFNDILYIASASAFATLGATVTLTLTLSAPTSGST